MMLGVIHHFCFKFVHPPDDPFGDPIGIFHRRHDVIIVLTRDIVDHIFIVLIHPLHAIHHNDGNLISVRRIVGAYRRKCDCIEQAMSILVLKTLSIERCSTCRSSDHETASTRVCSTPDEITNPLKTEHRVIDEEGNEIFSDKIGLLIARNLSSKHKNSKFIVDVKSTGLFKNDKILEKNGCETIYWKTGHSHIKRKVNKEKALAGFEKSGHFFFNQPLGYGYDDGINSAIQVCRLIVDQNKKMSEIIRSLPVTYQTPTMAPYCKDEEKYKVVDEMVKEVNKLKDEGIKIDNQSISEVLTVNGVRFSLEDGSWGLIRASSNKPSLVIVTESTKSNERKLSLIHI